MSSRSTPKARSLSKKAFSPSPIGKPLSQKEKNAITRCEKRFCKYYVPKMKKNINMYNPELVPKRLRHKNLTALCSNTFCMPSSFTKVYNNKNQLRNGFHKSIPTRRVQQLKRLGAISGVSANSFIHR